MNFFLWILRRFPKILLLLASRTLALPDHYRRGQYRFGHDDVYVVALHDGHTLEQHFETIGNNLSETARYFETPGKAPHRYYVTTIHDDRVLQAIRQDASVKDASMYQGVQWVFDSIKESGPEEVVEATGLDRALSTPPGQNKGQETWRKELWSSQAWYHNAIMTNDSKIYKSMDYFQRLYDFPLMVDPLAGEGVDLYIFDSGMDRSHSHFRESQSTNSRAVNFPPELHDTDSSPYCDSWTPMTDNSIEGHGTWVTGVAGGVETGLAPGATLVNVQIGCDGGGSDVISALRDVTGAHLRKKQSKPPGWKGSVINMSGDSPLAGHVNEYIVQWFTEALQAAYNAGIPIAAAAGNDGINSWMTFPCNVSGVFCVGAVDRNYRRWTYDNGKKRGGSNWGAVINGVAPGEKIAGADRKSGGYQWISGTSGAAPLVAAVMANFISFEGDAINGRADIVYERLVDNSLRDITYNWPMSDSFTEATPNLLVTNGINHPNRHALDPYVKPRDELRRDLDRCYLNITEVWTCQPAGANKYVRVSVADKNGNNVYSTPPPESEDLPGTPVDQLYIFKNSGMQKALAIKADSVFDYLTVAVEDESESWVGSWPSWTASKTYPIDSRTKGLCWLADRDWNVDGPQAQCPDVFSQSRDFICEYPCEGEYPVVDE